LKEFSWLFQWAYTNSNKVIAASFVAQGAASIFWAAWTFLMARRYAVYGLLTGTVGVLSSLMLLAPLGQPTYVLWWLPELTVLVVLARRWHLQLAIISVGPILFSIGLLGPEAFLAPLATYTHLVPAAVVNDDVIRWYSASGSLWGATRSDDYLAPASIAVVAAMFSLFASWMRDAIGNQQPYIRLRTGHL